jgi:bacterioferritin
MLACDLAFQMEQLPVLREAIALCEKESDYVSRDLLEHILEYEEEYTDWIETQQQLIQNTGIQNYLQSMIED